ncbi:MAG: glycosyltransferase family 4 protein [Planctomycetia bacterium]|nr:glycosyltransferase family 4 protein [Planctomycetia bacterium]
MKNITPKSSSKKIPQKAVVLETRVVTGTGGGPEKTILNTPRFMDPHGYKTLCAYMHPPGDPGFEILRQRAEKLNCPILEVSDHGLFDWSVIRQMTEICSENKVTIWHGHDYKSNILGLWVCRHYPMKLVSTVHGWVHRTWKTPLYYFLDMLSLKYYDHVICVSSDLQQKCLDFGVLPQKCTLVENAIDVNHFSRDMSVSTAKEKIGFPLNRIVVGAVGRLSPEKNFHGLIHVVTSLLDKDVPLELYIIGEGPSHSYLEGLIKNTKHQEHLHLLGFRNDLHDLYQAMDIFVLSSSREGLPNVVLEAMSYDVPVLSTRVAGVPRLITNGYNGVLVDIEDNENLSRMLEMLALEPEYRKMIGENGRMTITQNYNLDTRMKKVRDIYDQVLDINE